MPDGSTRPLFRAEALKWRQEAWIGSIQLLDAIFGRVALFRYETEMGRKNLI